MTSKINCPTQVDTRRDFLKFSAACGTVAAMSIGGQAAESGTGVYFENRGWLIGCWTRPWASHDYRVGFDAIAEAGFRFVALTGAKTSTGRVIAPKTSLDDATKVGEEARKRGLTITTVYGGDVALEKGTSELLRMLELCKAAGGWSVMLSRVGDEGSYDSCCKVIKDCCGQAASDRLAIVLKPHGGTTGTGPQLRNCIEHVGHKNFTLMYDPGNVFFYSKGAVDPAVDCRSVQGLVTGVSVKDYIAPGEIMFTPGTGKVDFPAMMRTLRDAGFTHGPLMIEALTPGDLPKTLVEAKKAQQFVEELVAA